MTKKGNEGFKNFYVNAYFTVRDQCHATGKYRGSAHRDFNVQVNLNHKIPVNLQNYYSYLIMQELGKFDFKINVIPNGLE